MTYTPPKIGFPLLLLVFGLFILALSMIFSEKQESPILFYILLGGWIVGAIIWMFMTKTHFHVNLSSASGEVHALTSKDRAYIEHVVVSINEGIAKFK
jgi:uncharacterized YccA/Bax inhibitor family protein